MMVKIFFDLDRLSLAHFVDLNETNKKVIEGNLPGLQDRGGDSNRPKKIYF